MPVQAGISSGWDSRLLSENESVAEILSHAGFRTAAFSSNVIINPDLGFDQGFDRFNMVLSVPVNCWRTGEALTDKAAGWLRENHAHPFFLFLHYIDPHHPYIPPIGYINFRGEDRVQPLDLLKVFIWWGPMPFKIPALDYPRFEITDTYHSLYRGEIRYLDYCLGQLIKEMEEIGVLDKTIIIITSDHGEEFLDHDLLIHGTSLYDEQIRIPLIIYDGRKTEGGQRMIDTLTSNLDIAPTILEYAGIPASEKMLGRSLVPLLQGEDSALKEAIFSELPEALNYHLFKDDYRKLKDTYFRAMVKGRIKLIKVTDVKTGGATMEIYDLSDDPGEQNNLALVESERFEREREEMEAFFNNLPIEITPAEGKKLSGKTIKLLKSLGYIQ